jgi:transcriptional regulator with XRE-family HTH domain
MRTGPADYAFGLGEVIRGYRLYMGLSRGAMATEIGVAIRSYERIEDGERACPPNFIDTIRGIVDRFDNNVEYMIADGPRDPAVAAGEQNEWHRAVACRAAVSCERITPLLVKVVASR